MSVSECVGRYRDRLRAQGLRPVQIWVPIQGVRTLWKNVAVSRF
ncbi:MAG: antitoxin MazE-like protein [Litorivicinaceae bacterium]